MKKSFRIIVLVLTIILFVTSVVWMLGVCMGTSTSFSYLFCYTLAITFGVGLFLFGLFGLCKLGDWAFKKD